MRKLVNLMLLVLLVVVIWPSQGYAATVPKLILDGKTLEPDVDPVVMQGYTMVPVSFITRELGVSIEYSAAAKSVTIHNDSTTIVLLIDNKIATVNDEPAELDAPVKLVKSRTMVPLRFVGERLGLNVQWEQQTSTVTMTRIVQAPTEEPQQPVQEVDAEATVGARPAPVDAAGLITGISFDGTAAVISYTGQIVPSTPFSLTDHDRIVLDMPLTGFAPEFVAGFTLQQDGTRSGEGIQELADHPLLKKIRYNITGSPSTVRVVLDLSQAASYMTIQQDGLIRIELTGALGGETPVVIPNIDPPPKGVYRVVIDAGHGAHDPGTTGISNTKEKDFNLSVALKLQALLEKESNIEVYLTRENDTYLTLDERAEFANKLQADLFISIHANSVLNAPKANGTETYYYHDYSKELAAVIHKNLLLGTGLADRKVKTAGFVVIKKTTMPAVLIEAGFLSNAGDEKALFNDSTQNRIAEQLLAGIKEYLKLK